jgi:predicted kinase
MMPNVRVIVVTGLPGVGKTTLARHLSERYRVPAIAKDLIKEPLLDVLGAADAQRSRQLSDASFAALFRVARELRASGISFVVEGNFRPGEHEAALLQALGTAQVAQVLCRISEVERIARLEARNSDPTRHAGHRLGEQLSAQSPPTCGDAFLDLPSARYVHDGARDHPVLTGLDDWMKLREASP